MLDAVPTTLDEQRKRQLEDNPEGHRWAVDNAWLSGAAADVVPAMRRAYTTLPNAKAFTIWFSMAPLRALPDMAFSLQSEIYLASYVALGGAGGRRALHRLAGRARWPTSSRSPSASTSATATSPAARCGSCPTTPGRGSRQIRAERDPDGLFVGYLAGPGGATNRNHWE